MFSCGDTRLLFYIRDFVELPRYENGDWAQRADWHRVVVFKPSLRESVLNYLKKGQRTLVTGKISYGEIVDKEGKTRLTASIVADDVVYFK